MTELNHTLWLQSGRFCRRAERRGGRGRVLTLILCSFGCSGFTSLLGEVRISDVEDRENDIQGTMEQHSSYPN